VSGPAVDFVSPVWLLLLLLVPLVPLVSRGSLSGLGARRRLIAVVLRSAAIALAVLALSRMRLLGRNDRLCVIFVLDRSASIPGDSQRAVLEQVLELQERRNAARGDQVGVVVFGRDPGIEVMPRAEDLPESLRLDGIATLIEPDASDLQAAIRLAVAAFPEGAGGKRLVLFSDGNENQGAALDEVRSARSLGVTVDVVPIVYSHPAEVLVEKLLVEPEVRKGEPFDIQVVVLSTAEVEARVRLFENDTLVSHGEEPRRLRAGKNFFEFRGLRRHEPGSYRYEAQVEPLGPEADAIPQNNRAFGFTRIEGEPKVLICAGEPELEGQLLAALRAENIAFDLVTPRFLPRDGPEYLEYDAIVISNVAAHQLTDERMLLFEALVKGMGIGFVMIGGEESFGAGGYQGTPVERLLPVDMDLKQKKVLPNGALAMVVHSCELGNGNFWARSVVQQAIRTLSPRDYAGVLYHDDVARERWLFPMTECTRKQWMVSRLNGFSPGDMMSFDTILRMALNGLQSTPASIRHIIILSDGDPSMPAPALVSQIIAAKITVSTVCYGAHGAVPPGMPQLAQQCGGKFYHLQNERDLPEIFIREATTVRKSLISEEPFRPRVAGWSPVLQGIDGSEIPELDGYVLTSPKPLASLLLIHPPSADDPSTDPVLATWSYGIGKAAAFTSDAGRRWGKSWAEWRGYQRFWSQLVRWVSRSQSRHPFRVSRQVSGDRARISIDAIDEQGAFINDLRFEGSVVLPAPRLESREVAVRQVGPGRYELEAPVQDDGTYMVGLRCEIDGQPANLVTGISVPYSSEYGRLASDLELMRRVAEAGGGRFLDPRSAPGAVFSRDFVAARTVEEIWRGLLVWALALFFADIFLRRVLIEYRRLWQKLLAGAAWLARRPRPVLERTADERLATLLRRKEEVRSRTHGLEARPESTAGEPPPVWAREPGAEQPAAEPAPRPKKPQKPAAPAAPALSEPQEASYTSRLLEAKRRARERGGKGGES
jgi:uncharacterized membrane protein